MNVFRLAGDVSHLVAIIILLLKIWRSKSCAGRLTLAPTSLHFDSVEPHYSNMHADVKSENRSAHKYRVRRAIS